VIADLKISQPYGNVCGDADLDGRNAGSGYHVQKMARHAFALVSASLCLKRGERGAIFAIEGFGARLGVYPYLPATAKTHICPGIPMAISVER
jgi:hypothetical protein